jgi:hypothetical protein
MPIQILSNNKMEPFEHNLHIDSEELTSRNVDIDCMCQSYIDKLEPRFFLWDLCSSSFYFSVCFFGFCLRPVYCIPNVSRVSGLSIIDCSFSFV